MITGLLCTHYLRVKAMPVCLSSEWHVSSDISTCAYNIFFKSERLPDFCFRKLRKMKKIVFVLLSVLLSGAIMATPHKKPEVKSTKQEGKFVVDGKTTDWKNNTLQFDNKTGFAYAFSNDNQTLFVRLKMLNANVQRKALITGFTLWVDPNGKGKQVLGIEYPQKRNHEQHIRKPGLKSAEQYRHPRQASNNHLTDEKISRFNAHYRKVQPKLAGFEKAGIKDAFAGTGGIRVLLQMDSLGHVVYEASIPLKMLFSNPLDYLSKDKPFSVLFKTGYLQIDMSRMQGPGGMGGNRGNMQAGNPSRMAFMQSMADPSRLKIKTVYLFQKK